MSGGCHLLRLRWGVRSTRASAASSRCAGASDGPRRTATVASSPACVSSIMPFLLRRSLDARRPRRPHGGSGAHSGAAIERSRRGCQASERLPSGGGPGSNGGRGPPAGRAALVEAHVQVRPGRQPLQSHRPLSARRRASGPVSGMPGAGQLRRSTLGRGGAGPTHRTGLGRAAWGGRAKRGAAQSGRRPRPDAGRAGCAPPRRTSGRPGQPRAHRRPPDLPAQLARRGRSCRPHPTPGWTLPGPSHGMACMQPQTFKQGRATTRRRGVRSAYRGPDHPPPHAGTRGAP